MELPFHFFRTTGEASDVACIGGGPQQIFLQVLGTRYEIKEDTRALLMLSDLSEKKPDFQHPIAVGRENIVSPLDNDRLADIFAEFSVPPETKIYLNDELFVMERGGSTGDAILKSFGSPADPVIVKIWLQSAACNSAVISVVDRSSETVHVPVNKKVTLDRLWENTTNELILKRRRQMIDWLAYIGEPIPSIHA